MEHERVADEVAELVENPTELPSRCGNLEVAKVAKKKAHRSMSVTVNPKVDFIDQSGNKSGSSTINKADPKSPFLRSNSLQASLITSSGRPTIPTGNMLTEALMAAAAEEKRRKKSVSASIRYLATEKTSHQELALYILATLLVVMTISFVVLAAIHFDQRQASLCSRENIGSFRPPETSLSDGNDTTEM